MNIHRHHVIAWKTWNSSPPRTNGQPTGSAIFRCGEQAAEHHGQTSKQIPVAAATWDKPQVVKQNHECANPEQCKHDDRHPTGAFFHGDRNGRRVSRGGWRCGAPTGVSLFWCHASTQCRGNDGASWQKHWQAEPVSKQRVLVVDNYDSFVYNLVQYLGELGSEPVVVRNDEHSVEALMQMDCDGIVISPGPGRPEDAGVTCELIRAAAGRTPLLGVCLGHQAIGHVFGAQVVRAPELRHGKTSHITHDGKGLFTSLSSPLAVTRYHSLVIDPQTVPITLAVTATTTDGTVMGVRHQKFAVEGVQFHPESILTEHGHTMLRNFLQLVQ